MTTRPYPLDAFSGEVSTSQTGFLYRIALAVVAWAMVLLPAVYVALIVLTAWGVAFHLSHGSWILESRVPGLLRVLIYVAPAVAGITLVLFMIKPLFARRPRMREGLAVTPDNQQLLFSFVERISELVRAPIPQRIELDCKVNASARLARGWWRTDLTLTIGLPLVAGLDMQQFAGVLAHELGHFTQGAGMRLTYIVRMINLWFARVVYERDDWDVRLDEYARHADFRIAFMLQIARGCVWVTRKILWGLMRAGHAISCLMLRQMEYDADSYEARVAGSAAFATTIMRLQELNVAAGLAYQDARASWNRQQLPDNLPRLISERAALLPADVHKAIVDQGAGKRTRWSDTHPCDADRVRAARALDAAGIFHQTAPAADLFADFSGLARAVTDRQYRDEFGLQFNDANLVPVEEVLRTAAAKTAAAALVKRFYGAVEVTLAPLFVDPALPTVTQGANVRAVWEQSIAGMERLRPTAERQTAECLRAYQRLSQVTVAQELTGAGFTLDSTMLALLPACGQSAGEQHRAAETACEAARYGLTTHVHALAPFMAAVRLRVATAFQLAAALWSGPDAEGIHDLTGHLRLLHVLGGTLPTIREIDRRLLPLVTLAGNYGNHPDPEQVEKRIEQLTTELDNLIRRLQGAMEGLTYPFSDATTPQTLSEYARAATTTPRKWQALAEGQSHVNQLSGLYVRLVETVLTEVERAEALISRTGEQASV